MAQRTPISTRTHTLFSSTRLYRSRPGRTGLCTGCRSGRGELTPGQSAPLPCAAMAVLGDYETERFTWAGKTRDVYRRGSGPAVIVIAEMPGITPSVVAFADRVVELGCTAVLPPLFGVPGAEPGPAMKARAIGPACVSRSEGRRGGDGGGW